MVSISGYAAVYDEGSISFFQVRLKGALVEEKRFAGETMSFALLADCAEELARHGLLVPASSGAQGE